MQSTTASTASTLYSTGSGGGVGGGGQFGEITSFEEFPSERFKEQLEQLSTSKDSIDKATQFVMDNLSALDDLFDVLLNRMRKSAFSKRLSFFYLIDCICQRCNAKKNNVYRSFISDNIDEILPLILPDDNIEMKQKNRAIIEKVLDIWESKNIFDDQLLAKANSILSGTLKESSRLVCPDLTEKELAKLFKRMEDDRRELKRTKYEIKGYDNPLEEFIDFWCRVCFALGLQISPTMSVVTSSDQELYNQFKKEFVKPEWTNQDIEYPTNFVDNNYNSLYYESYFYQIHQNLLNQQQHTTYSPSYTSDFQLFDSFFKSTYNTNNNNSNQNNPNNNNNNSMDIDNNT